MQAGCTITAYNARQTFPGLQKRQGDATFDHQEGIRAHAAYGVCSAHGRSIRRVYLAYTLVDVKITASGRA